MKRSIFYVVIGLVGVSSFLPDSADARVGGGRSFGNKGSRGFGTSQTVRSAPARPYDYRSQPSSSQHSQPFQNPPLGNPGRSSFLRNMGAGLAGGFLGSMLFRSIGGGNSMAGYGGAGAGTGSGLGLLEILLIGGLLFWLYRTFVSRSQAASSTSSSQSSSSDGASQLMRQARGQSQWSPASDSRGDDRYEESAPPIQTELATDLFFQIQGAWGNRDLTEVRNILEPDVETYLDKEISRLKEARQINRLENIAVRGVEVTEAWRELGKDYSTVRFTANLLDYTMDENSHQIVEGSKSKPVKFEEFWTFSKDANHPSWKLSALEQS